MLPIILYFRLGDNVNNNKYRVSIVDTERGEGTTDIQIEIACFDLPSSVSGCVNKEPCLYAWFTVNTDAIQGWTKLR